MNISDYWYKNAVIYAVDVRRFMDSDGDGWGDFPGLTSKLDYLADLGVTCLWLLPCYPTPYRDNGYDITNYYEIDPRLGTFEDFTVFVQKAGERSMRVMMDLVMDHTSDQHPWFQAARHDAASHYHGYYIWSDMPPPTPEGKGPIFPGEETSVWTYDELANKYFHHRFYHFEPDLNTANPDVHEEIKRVMDFWLSFGISGFRIDAASHMFEGKGREATQPVDPHGMLKDLRSLLDKREKRGAVLGEVDVAPEKLAAYFGDGDEFNLLFNFLLNNYLFLALARQQAKPIERALNQLPTIPAAGQWANFLRNLDELDLERLTEADRQEVFKALAPEKSMQIYERGIRRRIAPMLGRDRHRLEMIFSLLFSLPGTPLFIYGDEIGMGEDLEQPGRDAVRAPMQWSDDRNAGFSNAPRKKLVQPVIEEGPFSYRQVNVKAQQEDPNSLLNWMKHLIRIRRSCPEFGFGGWHLIEVQAPSVLACRLSWKNGMIVTVHNLSDQKQRLTLDLRDQRGRQLVDLFGKGTHEPLEEGMYEIELGAYGYKWYRVEGERTEA